MFLCVNKLHTSTELCKNKYYCKKRIDVIEVIVLLTIITYLWYTPTLASTLSLQYLLFTELR